MEGMNKTAIPLIRNSAYRNGNRRRIKTSVLIDDELVEFMDAIDTDEEEDFSSDDEENDPNYAPNKTILCHTQKNVLQAAQEVGQEHNVQQRYKEVHRQKA
ncbi:hypothetical protein QE152_g5380 [Popillia japonica]|uniref:Uncharacterized protein n=1 Tax=Popillia japonica TaxID=7064 RepID=A0AAW1MQL6_POPJA